MSCRSIHNVLRAELLALALSVGLCGILEASADECERTSQLRVYSNASFIKEAGDVVGYELAVRQTDGTSISALLYFYEGTPNDEGIYVSGHISAGKLVMEGDWVEHLTEYPSKKEIVKTHHVTVNGTIDRAKFRGAIKMEGVNTQVNVRLKRVVHIWTCRS